MLIIAGLTSCNAGGGQATPTVIPATNSSVIIKKILDIDEWRRSGIYEITIDGTKYVVFRTDEGVSVIKP